MLEVSGACRPGNPSFQRHSIIHRPPSSPTHQLLLTNTSSKHPFETDDVPPSSQLFVPSTSSSHRSMIPSPAPDRARLHPAGDEQATERTRGAIHTGAEGQELQTEITKRGLGLSDQADSGVGIGSLHGVSTRPRKDWPSSAGPVCDELRRMCVLVSSPAASPPGRSPVLFLLVLVVRC